MAGTDRLNPISLLNKAKRRLGVKSMILPFEDDELLDILYEETLPTFSIYFPRYFRYIVNIDNLRKADNVNDISRRYFLNLDELKNIQIIDIEDITPVELPLEYYYAPGSSGGSLDAFGMMADMHAESVIESMLHIPAICKFEPPNVLLIDNFSYSNRGQMELKLLIVHAKDLSTIQYAQRDMLFELFKLDLQIALYAELKHYDKIDTTFGQIDLKIDDWSDAENKRDELVKNWDTIFLSFREKTIFK